MLKSVSGDFALSHTWVCLFLGIGPPDWLSIFKLPVFLFNPTKKGYRLKNRRPFAGSVLSLVGPLKTLRAPCEALGRYSAGGAKRVSGDREQ